MRQPANPGAIHKAPRINTMDVTAPRSAWKAGDVIGLPPLRAQAPADSLLQEQGGGCVRQPANTSANSAAIPKAPRGKPVDGAAPQSPVKRSLRVSLRPRPSSSMPGSSRQDQQEQHNSVRTMQGDVDIFPPEYYETKGVARPMHGAPRGAAGPKTMTVTLNDPPERSRVHWFDSMAGSGHNASQEDIPGAGSVPAGFTSLVKILEMAKSEAGVRITEQPCQYHELVSPQTLYELSRNVPLMRAINRQGNKLSKNVLEAGKDLRDSGHHHPYITDINEDLPMSMPYLSVGGSDIQLVYVRKGDKKMKDDITRIFLDRDVLNGTEEQLDNSMNMYLERPYYTLAAVRGGIVVGGVVFRAHRLNTAERVINIELIATEDSGIRGVGTTIMRVLRRLAQATPFHHGYVMAQTMKTEEAMKFYERKLPQLESPLARSLHLSLLCLDPHYASLYAHLSLRADVVYPVMA